MDAHEREPRFMQVQTPSEVRQGALLQSADCVPRIRATSSPESSAGTEPKA
jgi:hypothetical protein